MTPDPFLCKQFLLIKSYCSTTSKTPKKAFHAFHISKDRLQIGFASPRNASEGGLIWKITTDTGEAFHIAYLQGSPSFSPYDQIPLLQDVQNWTEQDYETAIRSDLTYAIKTERTLDIQDIKQGLLILENFLKEEPEHPFSPLQKNESPNPQSSSQEPSLSLSLTRKTALPQENESPDPQPSSQEPSLSLSLTRKTALPQENESPDPQPSSQEPSLSLSLTRKAAPLICPSSRTKKKHHHCQPTTFKTLWSPSTSLNAFS